MGGTAESVVTAGERALKELAPELEALKDEAVVRPSADPHSAAVTALLVADYLGQSSLRGKLAAAAPATATTMLPALRRLARAILATVDRLGGDYLPESSTVPADLLRRGAALRTAITTALEKALPNDADVKLWLDAIRLGDGVVDLVYDLRSLAELCARHLGDKPGTATAAAVEGGRSCADAIEKAIRQDDAPEQAKQRDALARLWTLFVPAYDGATAAGRAMGEKDQHFPPLALIASHRRARRRPLSLAPGRTSNAPSSRGSISPLSAPPLSIGRVGSPALPQIDEIGEVDIIEEVEVVRSEAPRGTAVASAPPVSVPPVVSAPPVSAPPVAAPPVAAAPVSAPPIASAPPVSGSPSSGEATKGPESRRENRATVEIEVGIGSESNFYVGFTENLSGGGVFVATYMKKEIGARIEVALSFPDGEELRVPGVVRWLREASHDGWPGLGVQFDGLTPAVEAKVRKFIALREPMFYDD